MQNYLDFIVFAAGQSRDLSQFILEDVDEITTFHYSGKGKYEWLLMQKLMSTSITAYESVRMGPYNTEIQCDAVLEASESCGAIKNGDSLGYVNCGGIEQSAQDTNWWIGNCSDTFAVVATTMDSGYFIYIYLFIYLLHNISLFQEQLMILLLLKHVLVHNLQNIIL